MIKLSLDFQINLDVGPAFSGVCGITRLIPFENGRAVVFGWGTYSGNYQAGPHQYWFAEVRREGVSQRLLPLEMTHRPEGLMAPLAADSYVQAFKLGEKFGLLLSTERVLLFAGIHDDPVTIPIGNHFSALGEPSHPLHPHDSYFTPVHCGNAAGSCVPVILSDPSGRGRGGRHVCLLEIDQANQSARWLHTQPDGSPRTTVLEEYLPFHSDAAALPPGGARINRNGGLEHDLPPLIYDCAWIDRHWYLYLAGWVDNYVRFGIPLGILTRNFVDLSLLEPVFKPPEQSFGHICASLDRMIISPLRANGQRKGKQTVFMFGDGDEHALTLPRGLGKFQVAEHCAGHYWLLPAAMEYNRMPLTLAACTA